MAIGSSLGITLPTQGANTGTWGTDLNAELQKVIDAVEAQVPASAIDFSADFDLNNNALTSISYSSYDQQTSVTALNSTYFDTAGNLYARDGSNNVIQMTANGGLNNASAGGLGDSGGDYGTGGITLDWDGTRYNAKNGSGANDYADIRFNSAILRDGTSNDITLDCPSISSSYTLTLPTAVPSSTGLFLQGTTAGALSFSNSTAQDVTLTSTAEVKHGARSFGVHALTGRGNDVTNTDWTYRNTFDDIGCTDVSTNFFIPINLAAGFRITQLDVFFFGGDTATKTARIQTKTAADGTAAGTVFSGSNTSTTAGSATLSILAPNYTILAGDLVVLEYDPGHVNDRIAGIKVTYDRP